MSQVLKALKNVNWLAWGAATAIFGAWIYYDREKAKKVIIQANHTPGAILTSDDIHKMNSDKLRALNHSAIVDTQVYGAGKKI